MASGVEIRRNGLPKLQQKVAGGGGGSEILDKIMFDIERRTKENIVMMGAVDTGNMLNTTHSVPNNPNGPNTREVRVPAEYAAYVHDGYAREDGGTVAGRPFMAQAVAEVEKEVGQIAKGIINRR